MIRTEQPLETASAVALLAAGLDALGAAALLLDAGGRIAYAGEPAARLLGYRADELAGRDWGAFWLEIAPGEAAPDAEARRVLLQRGPVRAGRRMVSGTAFSMVTLEDLGPEEGREYEVQRVFRDSQEQADDLFALYQITQFLNTATELDQLCATFLRELERITTAEIACLYLITPDGSLQPRVWHGLSIPPPPQLNTAAAAVEWLTAQAGGLDLLALPLLSGDQAVGLALLAHGGMSGRDLRFLFTVAKEMGTALLAMEGRQALLTDIMRQKQVEQMKSDFFAEVSHQLRTPLALLRGYSDTLLHLELSPAERHACAAGIAATTERLTQLVDQIIEVTRIEDGRLQLRRERLLLAETISAAINALPLDTQTTRIVTEIGHDLPLLDADPQRLEQALINLLDNALKYSPHESQVTIRARRAGTRIMVQVEDEGIGIPPEEQGAIFGKFYRAANARESRLPGTGLGLFITRSIVEAHGGRIMLASEPDLGTCVSFWLPVAESEDLIDGDRPAGRRRTRYPKSDRTLA